MLPLLATQLLWINLVTDSWPALALGVDPASDDVMARKPRQLSERVIDARMWAGVIQIGLVVVIVTLLTIDIFLPGGLIEGTHDLATARTAGFTVLLLAHLFNAFNARSETHECVRAPVRQPMALGRDRTLSAVARGGRQPRIPEPGLRHGAAGVRPVAAVHCDGQRSAVVQRIAQAGGSRMEPERHRPKAPSALTQVMQAADI